MRQSRKDWWRSGPLGESPLPGAEAGPRKGEVE